MSDTVFYEKSPGEDLAEMFPGTTLGLRELKFLVGYLRIDCDLEKIKKDLLEKIVLDRIKNHILDIEKHNILAFLMEAKISEEKLSFIEDRKSHLYLTLKIINQLKLNTPLILTRQINYDRLKLVFNPKDLLIFLISLKFEPIEGKNKNTDIFTLTFNNHLSKIKFIKWYEESSDRISIAHEYFIKKGYLTFEFSTPFSIDDLMIFFWDDARTKDQVNLIDINFRRYYHNKKSRENKSTKQVNFSLSIKPIKEINRLAKKYGLKKSTIIEIAFKDKSFLTQIDLALRNKLSMTHKEEDVIDV